MSKALVFLRSFGDFTIAISVLRKSSILEGYVFYASKHLEPLYIDLKNSLPDIDLNIHFIDLEIKKKVFGFFTNKHSIELHSFRELMNLRRWERGMSNGDVYFEQRRKQWMIAPYMGKTFPYIHKKSRNIYQSYFQHFGVEQGLLSIHNPARSELKKILVLPESRKPSKSFKPLFIHQLTKSLLGHGFEVTTGFFKKLTFQTEGKVAVHVAFADLIHLIKEADLVVTADSLPAHLAQLLGKPHFVYYEAKPNQEWTTPFCNLNKAFGEMGDLSSLQTYLNAS
jgi:hypothetical protein